MTRKTKWSCIKDINHHSFFLINELSRECYSSLILALLVSSVLFLLPEHNLMYSR